MSKTTRNRDSAVRALGLTVSTMALLTASPALAKADFSGFWRLTTDPTAVAKAASTPAAASKVKALLEARGLDAPNGSPEYARIWCTAEGMPWQTTHSLPFRISQGPLTVSMTYTVESDPRHIYIDGQPQTPLDEFDLTSVGNSVARWQGDTLVATTHGFLRGVLVLPGDGLRSERSRLVERYRLVDQDTLRVTYTWTDPTTLRRPHTYTFEYARVPGPVWMSESQCDPFRAMRTKGLPLPPDAPP